MSGFLRAPQISINNICLDSDWLVFARARVCVCVSMPQVSANNIWLDSDQRCNKPWPFEVLRVAQLQIDMLTKLTDPARVAEGVPTQPNISCACVDFSHVFEVRMAPCKRRVDRHQARWYECPSRGCW